MPVTAGPIYPGIKDGLVFAIDPANKDSWAGPTSTTVDSLTLYIDGVSSTNRTTDNSGNYSRVNNEFSIGSIDDSSFDYIGLLSNVILYNRGLSASEVTQNYNALKGRFGL